MIEKCKRYATLRKQKDALEKELELLSDELKILESEIIQIWDQDEIQNMTVDGVQLYRSQTTYASAKDVQRMGEVLDQLGEGYLVQKAINGNSLSAFIRRLEKEGDLPSSIVEAEKAEWIKISRTPQIRMRGT